MFDYPNLNVRKMKNSKFSEIKNGRKLLCFNIENVSMKILKDPLFPSFILLFYEDIGSITNEKNVVHLHLTKKTGKYLKLKMKSKRRRVVDSYRHKSKSIEVATNRMIKYLRKKYNLEQTCMTIMMHKNSSKKALEKQRSLHCFLNKTLKEKLKLEMYPYSCRQYTPDEFLIGAVLRPVESIACNGKYIIMQKVHSQDEIIGLADWLGSYIQGADCSSKILDQIESKNIHVEDIQLIVTVGPRQKKIYFLFNEEIISKLNGEVNEFSNKVLKLRDKR